MAAADEAEDKAELRRRQRTPDESASVHLVTAALCAVVAVVAWYVAVERPRIDGLESLHAVVKEMRRIQDRNPGVKSLADRGGEKSSPGEVQSLISDYRKDMDAKALRLKAIVEDGQRQQVKDKKIILDECRAEAKALRALEAKVAAMAAELQDLRAELQGAERLERAAEALTGAGAGRVPVEAPPAARDGGGPAASGGTRQAVTGGMVELREGDFDRLLQEGDAWVVMFYAPWCAHCKAAEPDFQQAGLQAGVHFARLDAVKHSDISEREQVTGFPTFKAYVGGRMVKQYQGDRTVAGFLKFAKEIEVLHY